MSTKTLVPTEQKRLVVHDFLKTTHSLLRRGGATSAVQTLWQHRCPIEVDNPAFPRLKWLVPRHTLEGQRDSWPLRSGKNLSRTCFCVTHHPEVVGTIVSQATAPAFALISGQQDKQTSIPKKKNAQRDSLLWKQIHAPAETHKQ